MTIDFSIIGKRIREIRERKNISREQLSSMIGVSASHLRHIEIGHRNPSAEMLINIAFSLEVPVDELLTALNYPSKEYAVIYDLLKDCSGDEKTFFQNLICYIKPELRRLK